MSSNSIKVFAPASVANVACGYDIFGFALEGIGDTITLSKRPDDQLVVQEVFGAELPTDPAKNVATVAIKSLLDHLGSNQGFDISLEKGVPPGSGIGSSASSASAAVFAASQLMESGLSKKELLPFAMDGEFVASKSYHADNVSPSLLGGFCAVRSVQPHVDVFQIKTPGELRTLIIFPQVTVNTAEAKKILGDTIALEKARVQWGNVAGLVHGMMTENWELISNSLEDVVAEPLRKSFIPHYEQVKEVVLKKGAVGFNISGSGPAMFAFFKKSDPIDSIISEINDIYKKASIECRCYTSKINEKGAEVVI